MSDDVRPTNPAGDPAEAASGPGRDADGDDGRRSTSRRPPSGRTASGRRASLDPQGRRALFETPVSAARDTIRSGTRSDGKESLYSTGPRRPGTVVVTCTSCRARSRINLTELGLRWLTGTIWIPGRRNGHWMRCPSCHRRSWCSIGWQD